MVSKRNKKLNLALTQVVRAFFFQKFSLNNEKPHEIRIPFVSTKKTNECGGLCDEKIIKILSAVNLRQTCYNKLKKP